VGGRRRYKCRVRDDTAKVCTGKYLVIEPVQRLVKPSLPQFPIRDGQAMRWGVHRSSPRRSRRRTNIVDSRQRMGWHTCERRVPPGGPSRSVGLASSDGKSGARSRLTHQAALPVSLAWRSPAAGG
jgi:hypothetical protein